MQTAFTGIRVNRIRIGIAILAVVFIVGILLMAAVPPVSRDALTHHLAVPKLYLEQGGIVELPHCPFSYYPMNLDLLYMVPLYLGNDILAKYIHFSFALLTALLIFKYLKKRIGTAYGLLGVLLFISIPVIIKLSVTVYVDLGLIFFSTAALLAFVNWIESGFKTGPLALSAICCGLALGTKYNGLIAFFLLAMFVPFACAANLGKAGRSGLRPVQAFILFSCIAIFVFSPWLVRNYTWTGNPVYPLFNSFFQRGAIDLVPDKVRSAGGGAKIPLNHFSFRANAYNESLLEIATIPLRVFFQGQDDTPKYFDGVLNPYLFFLPLLWLGLSFKKALNSKEPNFYLFLFALLYLLFVFARQDMRIRWIAPIIPPLVILSVYGCRAVLLRIDKHLNGQARTAAITLALLLLGMLLSLNLNYLGGLFGKIAPCGYISGRVDREAYISRFRPAYKVHVYAGEHLPAGSKILGQFLGNRGYYSRHDIVFADSLLKGLIDRYGSEQAVSERLQGMGLTHIMLRQDLFEKWAADNFKPGGVAALKSFFSQHLLLLYSHTGYMLYKLI